MIRSSLVRFVSWVGTEREEISCEKYSCGRSHCQLGTKGKRAKAGGLIRGGLGCVCGNSGEFPVLHVCLC